MRPTPVGGLAGPLVALALVGGAAGCIGGGDGAAPPSSPASWSGAAEAHTLHQGTNLGDEDLNVGLADVSGGTAVLHVAADDFDFDVLRGRQGASFQVGRRAITLQRVDEDGEAVVLAVQDPGPPSAT
ncbi:hypothetical protein HDA32_001306 [Spinactinospora alkalitolerans]|uniref:Uncharacterized protein n=1 Tax=Spinactinospora alkalitolerans TaxID=687207 RepID=A0A852TPA5_9ACTN|nr:hypothetical protein [Spinactinospora alkalitolerans]NYE46186.1 hypothetical protein [Spinactinospora alkalitolerans]